MADNNEKFEKDLQNQEADIEVDVTNEVVEGIEEQPKKDETQKEPTDDKQQELPKEEPKKEDRKESEKEKNKEEDKGGVKEETQEKVPEELGKKENKGTKDEPAGESEGEPEGDKTEDTGDNTDKTKIEDVADEPSNKEKELMAQIEDMEFDKKENETLRQIDNMVNKGNADLAKHVQELQSALKEAFKHFNIDESKSLEELEKQDPTKAVIAKTLIETANQRYMERVNDINAKITAMEDEAIFARAEKIIKKYNLSPEQLMAAAQTFANILNEVGVKDLKEDLTAKIKLSVAQAKMDIPDVVEVVQVKEAVKAEEKDVQNDAVKEEAPTVEEEPKAVEEVPPVEEALPAEEKKPDLSEFMEGIEGNASKASDVNADNVLAKLNALPFKERTKFYKENMDLINEAMKKARG